MNMITARERTSSFTDEVSICISRIGSGNYSNFPQLEVSNGEISLSLSLKKKKIADVTAVFERLYFSQ